MKNLVLIGMPGSGKTCFGKRLARRLRLPLLDTDSMIINKAGKSIPAIFAEDGEEHFRELETLCTREASRQKGAIISTGGGLILRKENMEALIQNGIIVFIDRHPSLILRSTSLDDRPLVRDDKDRLFRLYRQRIHLYRSFADYTLCNTRALNGRMSRGVLRILRYYKKHR